MALPAHLEKYSALVDLVVDVLVREIEQAAEMKPPASTANRAGGGINSEREQQRGQFKTVARATASL